MKEVEKKKYLKNLEGISKILGENYSNEINSIKDGLEKIEVLVEEVGELPAPEVLIGKMFGYAVFSDGGCRQNPGLGAWGAIIQNPQGEVLYEGSAGKEITTNNQMELTGAIEGLNALKEICQNKEESISETEVFLVTDSQYVAKGLNEWMKGWKSRGWRKADKKAPENLELWQSLDELKSKIPLLKAVWVKGHSGHPQNERCDELANLCMDQLSSEL